MASSAPRPLDNAAARALVPQLSLETPGRIARDGLPADGRAGPGDDVEVGGGGGLREDEGVGEDGGGRTRGQRTEGSGQKKGGKEEQVRKWKT